jgi:hypothetical protein
VTIALDTHSYLFIDTIEGKTTKEVNFWLTVLHHTDTYYWKL